MSAKVFIELQDGKAYIKSDAEFASVLIRNHKVIPFTDFSVWEPQPWDLLLVKQEQEIYYFSFIFENGGVVINQVDKNSGDNHPANLTSWEVLNQAHELVA